MQKNEFQDANRDFQHAHELNLNDTLVLRFWAWCEAGAGEFEREWSGRDQTGREVNSGIYFARLEAGEFTATRKMLLVKLCG